MRGNKNIGAQLNSKQYSDIFRPMDGQAAEYIMVEMSVG
jgi:hypothetical protein